MSRSAAGQMRIDYGATSVITNPATQQMQLLDHIKKEFKTIPLPAAALPQLTPPGVKIPGMPTAPAQPTPPAMSVKDLGIRLIAGHEVAGKQFTLPSLTPPKPPALPQAQIPGMPKAPAIPGAPGAPPLPVKPDPSAIVSEVWTSTTLHVPVLSRITGSFGQQMCHCKNVAGGEPHPSTFQIPADYKQVGLPPPPQPPAITPPQAPQMPGFTPPQAPKAPSFTPPAPPKFPF